MTKLKNKKVKILICPLCGKKVEYNFCSDRWECEECNFSDLYCPKRK